MSGTIFKKNYAFEGGAIQIENDCNLKLENIDAEANYALKSGGVLQVLTYSTIEIVSS